MISFRLNYDVEAERGLKYQLVMDNVIQGGDIRDYPGRVSAIVGCGNAENDGIYTR